MAQISRIVKVGLVKDVPLLHFQSVSRGLGILSTKLFLRIGKEPADNMDTCIMK
jgi:hypothetical protein